jgi:transposase
MEPAGRLACDLRGSDRGERHLLERRHRQHARPGAPLGRRRKRGDFAQGIGRSRGGRTSKLHGLTDDDGRPRVLLLSPGNINDIRMAGDLVLAAGPIRRLIADRGYDANHLRTLLAERGAEAVIPSTTSRKAPIPYDRDAYRSRNLVERMWGRLKDWRRIATRYDKLGRNFLSSALIAATFIYWLN